MHILRIKVVARASCHTDFLFVVGAINILVFGLYDLDSKNEKAPGYAALVILFGSSLFGRLPMRLDCQPLFGQQGNRKCQAQPPFLSCNHGPIKWGALDLISEYKKIPVCLDGVDCHPDILGYCVTGKDIQALRPPSLPLR